MKSGITTLNPPSALGVQAYILVVERINGVRIGLYKRANGWFVEPVIGHDALIGPFDTPEASLVAIQLLKD